MSSPKGRAGHAFLRYGDNNAVLLGGYDDKESLDDIWMYDGGRETWVMCSYNRLNPHPLPRVDFDCCILGSKLFLFGGMQSDGEQVLILNDLWSLDLNSGIWTMITEECPVAERMGHVCVALDDTHMLVHGGECMGKCFDDIWIYNASTNVWISNASVTSVKPVGRCAHSSCFINETQTFVLFGGYTLEDGEPIYLNDLWTLDVSALGAKGAMWKQIKCADEALLTPSPRDRPALTVLPNSRLLIAGGFGLAEVEADEDEEAMLTEEQEQDQDQGVELSYLGDFWLVDVDVSSSVALYTQMYTSDDDKEEQPSLWADNSGRRGCKVLAQPDGTLLSFGGFNGSEFSCALEATVLR